MNKAGGFSEFVELLFRWETDKRGKRIRRIIADCAELKEAEVGYRSEGGWGGEAGGVQGQPGGQGRLLLVQMQPHGSQGAGRRGRAQPQGRRKRWPQWRTQGDQEARATSGSFRE